MNSDLQVSPIDAGTEARSDQELLAADAGPAVPQEASPEALTPTDGAPETPVTDDETVARLAALKPLEYDRVRREAAREMGVMVATLDALVKEARDGHNDADRFPFPEVEPWPEPIDPAQLLDEVAATINRFVVLESEQADGSALWTAQTYFIDDIDISPILMPNAPERACAKTLLQTVLGLMSYRPLPAANASLSALFRAVEVWKPTIFIDEADTFFRDNAELHGMVNAGYKRGGFVLRSEAVGDGYEPRMFSVYSAKSIAGIGLERHLPDSTMSRGIVINMRRKLPHEKVERLRHADPSLFTTIAAKLARFAEDYSRQVRLARPVLPDELSDRSQDNWEGLFAIAECAGPAWVQRATKAALKLSRSAEGSATTGNALLADIRGIFGRKGTLKISTVELIKALVADDEKSWATYNRGKPLAPRQLAKQLAGYGIQPKTVRLGPKNTPKGYEFSQFDDAFARYLPASSKLPQQRNDPPEAMTDEAEDVADEVQHASDAEQGAAIDKLLPMPTDAELLEFMTLHDRSDVPDKGPVF